MATVPNKAHTHQSEEGHLCGVFREQHFVMDLLGEGAFGEISKCSNMEAETMEVCEDHEEPL